MTLRTEAREGLAEGPRGLAVWRCLPANPSWAGRAPAWPFREPLLPSAGRVEVSQCGSAARGDAGTVFLSVRPVRLCIGQSPWRGFSCGLLSAVIA